VLSPVCTSFPRHATRACLTRLRPHRLLASLTLLQSLTVLQTLATSLVSALLPRTLFHRDSRLLDYKSWLLLASAAHHHPPANNRERLASSLACRQYHPPCLPHWSLSKPSRAPSLGVQRPSTQRRSLSDTRETRTNMTIAPNAFSTSSHTKTLPGTRLSRQTSTGKRAVSAARSSRASLG
jgi:hypothetical protein